MTQLMLKAASQEVMENELIRLGLAKVIDGEFQSVANVSITGTGKLADPVIWHTKPEYDKDGNVTKAGVESPDFHRNVNDNRPNGIKDPTPYHELDNPTGTDWGKLTWIDPAKVKTPASVWA